MFLENLFCIKEALINSSARLSAQTHLISVSLKLFCKAAQKLLKQRKKICSGSRETKNF